MYPPAWSAAVLDFPVVWLRMCCNMITLKNGNQTCRLVLCFSCPSRRIRPCVRSTCSLVFLLFFGLGIWRFLFATFHHSFLEDLGGGTRKLATCGWPPLNPMHCGATTRSSAKRVALWGDYALRSYTPCLLSARFARFFATSATPDWGIKCMPTVCLDVIVCWSIELSCGFALLI